MNRAGLTGIALFFSWLAWAGVAEAQAIEVQILSFEGRGSVDLGRLGSTTGTPVRADECGAAIEFRFRNIDRTRSQLQFYRGSMCDQVSARTDTTSTACQPLEIPSVAIENRTERTVTVPVDELVPCGSGSSGVENIWVLALNNETDEVSGPGQRAQFNIAFNFAVPGGPAGLMATPGEAGATLSWESEGAEAQFQVFVDPEGCTDGIVTSERLTPDATEATLRSLRVGAERISGTTTTVPYPESVPIGGEMAVAIRSVSRAGNPSELSEIICVERIETTSWWDMRCAGPDADELCSEEGGCAVTGSRRAPSFALASLFALAIALFALRRSRR